LNSASISPDGRWAPSASDDETLRLWELDWECEFPSPADWDEGARPHLETFLTLRTPLVGQLPKDREPTAKEVVPALTRKGKPSWSEEDFNGLLHTLACAGYGWLRPEGVRRELGKVAASWTGPAPLPQVLPCPATESKDRATPTPAPARKTRVARGERPTSSGILDRLRKLLRL
jgi:hypothetical protein